MEFSCETQYDCKATRAMARALRKTVRRKKSLRSHVFGWCVVAFALILLFWTEDGGFPFQFRPRTVLTLAVTLALLTVLLFEDRINGYIAYRRMLPGTQKARVIFGESEFVCSTGIGSSSFRYDKINLIAEDADWFVFIFSANHAQVYDKRRISGGDLEDFRSFLETAIGKTVHRI